MIIFVNHSKVILFFKIISTLNGQFECIYGYFVVYKHC